MRITFFDLTRLSFYGGAERYLKEVGVCLYKKGHQVYGVGDSRPYFSFSILLGVFLAIIPIKDIFKHFKQVGKYPSIEPEYEKHINYTRLGISSLVPFSSHRKVVKKIIEASDLIFLKNEIADLIYFWLLNIKNQHKYIIAFSSTEYHQTDSLRAKAHNIFYLSKFYRKLVKNVGRVVVSNREDKRMFVKKFGLSKDKVRYIPYGLDPKDFTSYTNKKNTNSYNILFVGRLEEQKGIDILCEVIAQLLTSPIFLKLSFTIIGDGPQHQLVEDLVKKYNNVAWAGALPREEVIKAYYSHDLLIVPSKWETFSYVTLEAQFCGLPVIAFNIPGPQDIINDGETGRLIPPGNVGNFIDTVVECYESKHKFNKRHDISNKAIKEFSLDKTTNKLISLAG